MSNEIDNNEFDFPQLVRNMSTVTTSTTNSLNIQFSETTVLDEDQINAIKIHNNTSRETIISEINAIEYPIPSAGFPNTPETSTATSARAAISWWSSYGYGLRVDNLIYCTFNRKNTKISSESMCIGKFESKGSQSSSITRHIIHKHKFTEERRKF
jgi:hypothetical protein